MSCDPVPTANLIFTDLLAGEDIEVPDLSGVTIPEFESLNEDTFKSQPSIKLEDLTTGQTNGSGVFDKLMTSVTAHLDRERSAGRITNNDFAKSYVDFSSAAMATAVQFLLQKDQAVWNGIAARTAAQLAIIQLSTAQVSLEEAKMRMLLMAYQANGAKVEMARGKMALATAEIEYCTGKYQLEEILPKQALMLLAQGQQVEAQTDQIMSQTAMIADQRAQITAQTEQITAQTTMVEHQSAQLIAQTAQTTAQTIMIADQRAQLVAETEQTIAQTTMVDEQTAQLIAQTAMVVAQTGMVDEQTTQLVAQTANVVAQTDRVAVENQLTNKQIAQITAQITQLALEGVQTTAQTNAIEKQALQTVAQTLLTEKQTLQTDAQTLGIGAQTAQVQATTTTLLPQQVRGASAQADGQVLQNTTILPKQATMLERQIELTKEQYETQRAQTLDTRSDGVVLIAGTLGKQKELHAQQIISYQRDSQLKAARPFIDAWITMKTIDEGTLPPVGFNNANLDAILGVIRNDNDLT